MNHTSGVKHLSKVRNTEYFSRYCFVPFCFSAKLKLSVLLFPQTVPESKITAVVSNEKLEFPKFHSKNTNISQKFLRLIKI